jgi:predicted  nucleic acid-binding Zn-ribbon protein
MTTQMATYSLNSDVLQKFNSMYPRGKRTEVVNDLIKNYIKYQSQAATDDLDNELTQLEKEKAALLSRENYLRTLQETKTKEQNQQKLIEEKQFLEQEKRNISIIDDELFNLEEKWTHEKRNKLTQEWKEYIKQNNLLPNDYTRVQYWFRFYKSKNKEFE